MSPTKRTDRHRASNAPKPPETEAARRFSQTSAKAAAFQDNEVTQRLPKRVAASSAPSDSPAFDSGAAFSTADAPTASFPAAAPTASATAASVSQDDRITQRLPVISEQASEAESSRPSGTGEGEARETKPRPSVNKAKVVRVVTAEGTQRAGGAAGGRGARPRSEEKRPFPAWLKRTLAVLGVLLAIVAVMAVVFAVSEWAAGDDQADVQGSWVSAADADKLSLRSAADAANAGEEDAGADAEGREGDAPAADASAGDAADATGAGDDAVLPGESEFGGVLRTFDDADAAEAAAESDVNVIVIDAGEMRITRDAVYTYEMDAFRKTISFAFADKTGIAHYRFSRDRGQLAIIEGDIGSTASVMWSDFTWKVRSLWALLTRGEALSPADGAPASSTVTVLVKIAGAAYGDSGDGEQEEPVPVIVIERSASDESGASDGSIGSGESGDASAESPQPSEGDAAKATGAGAASRTSE